jgi:hypothetical protein
MGVWMLGKYQRIHESVKEAWADSLLKIPELFTRRPLFKHLPFKAFKDDIDLDPVESHLWQMISLTKTRFEREQLSKSEHADEYFDQTGEQMIDSGRFDM